MGCGSASGAAQPCPRAAWWFAGWKGSSAAAQPAGRAAALRLLGRVGCEGLNCFFRFTDQAGRSPLPPAFSRRHFNPSILFWASVTNVRLKYVFLKWVGLILRHGDTANPFRWRPAARALCSGFKIPKPNFTSGFVWLWLLVTSSGLSIPPIQRPTEHSGAFSPGLVFKHCNSTSSSTLWEAKWMKTPSVFHCKGFPPACESLSSVISTSWQILQYLVDAFVSELSVEAPWPWTRLPCPLP